jgi:hypothetical protein
LEQAARLVARSQRWIKRAGRSVNADAFIGPIVAGEKVLASTTASLYHFLKRNFSDALAIAMEDFGFLQAAFSNQTILPTASSFGAFLPCLTKKRTRTRKGGNPRPREIQQPLLSSCWRAFRQANAYGG